MLKSSSTTSGHVSKMSTLGPFSREVGVYVSLISDWSEKQCRVAMPASQPSKPRLKFFFPLFCKIASRCSFRLFCRPATPTTSPPPPSPHLICVTLVQNVPKPSWFKLSMHNQIWLVSLSVYQYNFISTPSFYFLIKQHKGGELWAE